MFDYESCKTCLMNERGEIIYLGSLKNGIPQGKGKVIKENGFRIEGEWNDGLMYIDEITSIDYEDGIFYLNELQSCCIFGCGKKMVKNEFSTFYKCNRKITIQTSDQLLNLTHFVNQIIINKGCCNDLTIDLNISDYLYLETIVVKKNSLKNIHSLTISKNPLLKTIDFLGSKNWEGSSFENIKSSVTIAGII